MPVDLHDALHDAVDDELPPLDHDALRRRARRRATGSRVATAGAVVAAGAAVAGTVTVLGPGALPTPEVAAPDDTPGAGPAITVAAAEVADAFAHCDVLDVDVLEGVEHLEPASAPPAAELYTAGRPTASGPHYAVPGPITDGVATSQLDERATTHNLEHGSIIVWFDPAQLTDDEVAEIDATVRDLNAAGFADNPARAGILASPSTDPGIDSGSAVALRAWGQARDCDGWDRDALLGFTAEHFGDRGISPEAAIASYPTGALQVTDGPAAG